MRQLKNAEKSKQKSNFRELYLYKIDTQFFASDHALLKKMKVFIQTLLPGKWRTNTNSNNSLNSSDFQLLNNPHSAQKENYLSESDFTTSNKITNGRNNITENTHIFIFNPNSLPTKTFCILSTITILKNIKKVELQKL